MLLILSFAGEINKPEDVGAAETDADAPAAPNAAWPSMFLDIKMEFVHEALANGLALLVNRIVSPGHCGKAGECAGVPGAETFSFSFSSGVIGYCETGASGADIGATAAILAPQR